MTDSVRRIQVEIRARQADREGVEMDVRCSPDMAMHCAVLRQIRAILSDDSLSDESCFDRIERVVCLFEALDIDTGNRHDFG